MPTNYYLYFLTALIPLVLGSIYYNPKVLGGAWLKVNGFTEENMRGANMPVIFGLTYLFSFLMSFIMTSIVVHQHGVFSLLMPDVMEAGSVAQQDITAFMAKYGGRFRTFGHGALHGFLISVFLVLPVIGISALFERRGGKYIFIHFGYFAITLMLIGGILCKYLVWAPIG